MFPQLTQPLTATLSGTVTWSSGALFDGYVVIGLGVPSDSNGSWPSLNFGAGKFPTQRLPLWTVVPISQGTFEPNTSLLFNTSIDPPGSKYGAYWYDSNWRLIYPAINVPATPFTVATNPYSISIPTLTVPTVASSIPLPQLGTGDANVAPTLTPGTALTITGTQDGSNVTFTLSATPAFLLLFRNGQLLAQNIDFTLSTRTITFVHAPAADDDLMAFALGGVQ